MALARRTGQRFQANIWPGFVDAMTSLLLVLMFVLTIFMIVQFILRETITGQETELDTLSAQVASLADALGLEKNRAAGLEAELGQVTATLARTRSEADAQAARIERLTADLAAGEAARSAMAAQIQDFEAQVARLLTERDSARGERDAAQGQVAELTDQRASLESALAAARTEIDQGAEAARLAAARREALQALIADLRRRSTETGAEAERLASALTEAEAARQAAEESASQAEAARTAAAEALSEEEAARLAEAEAARLLRERLQNSQTELTAMTLALEAERKRAEDTLTLLAAAEAARKELQGQLDERVAALTEAERDAALLAAAQSKLSEQEQLSAEAQRRVTLLNEQIAALRAQLGALQGQLDAAAERDRAADVQIEALGSQLNVALAQVAEEQRRRAELEAAERRRAEEEARRLAEEASGLQATAEELARYRSEFFGRLRDILAGREGVRVVGDRFVFSSEVLFQTGSADLAPEGRAQIASVAALLLDVAKEIPPGLDWILRVDGHTDNVPITPGARYADNWELSQARALSVVRYMIDALGFPPERLAATGFGEFQPVATGDSPEARAQNRRIELKLTER
jgi:chemotaxis protein MotB